MIELEKTWERRLNIFWAFIWRAGIGATVIGIAGMLLSLVYAKLSGNGFYEFHLRLRLVVELPLMLYWDFIAFRMVLEKHYNGFRIVLVPAPGTLESGSS